MGRLQVLAVAAAIPLGCDNPGIGSVCANLALCDAQPGAPHAIELLADVGGRGPGDDAKLDRLLEVVLPELAKRPGSTLRLWLLGEASGETAELASVAFTADLARFGSLGQHALNQQIERERAKLLAALDASAVPDRKASPIAEGLTEIAVSAQETGRAWTLIALTDGMQQTAELGFECGPLPNRDEFLDQLETRALLLPGSLAGAGVVMILGKAVPTPSSRCKATMLRATQIKNLWRAALRNTGADRVEIRTDVPTAQSLFAAERRHTGG